MLIWAVANKKAPNCVGTQTELELLLIFLETFSGR
jgi:hypothetical protein